MDFTQHESYDEYIEKTKLLEKIKAQEELIKKLEFENFQLKEHLDNIEKKLKTITNLMNFI